MGTEELYTEDFLANTDPREIVEEVLRPFGFNQRITEKMKDELIEVLRAYRRVIAEQKQRIESKRVAHSSQSRGITNLMEV